MSPTDLSQATPILSPCFSILWGLAGTRRERTLEKGQFAIPCPGPPSKFPGLPGSDPSLTPSQRPCRIQEAQGPEVELVTLGLPDQA